MNALPELRDPFPFRDRIGGEPTDREGRPLSTAQKSAMLNWRDEDYLKRMNAHYNVIDSLDELKGWTLLWLTRYKPGVVWYFATKGNDMKRGLAKDEIFSPVQLPRMNVYFCSAVVAPGDWCFFRNEHEGDRRYIKLFAPVPPVSDLPVWHVGDPRLILLPVEGPTGWEWNGDEDKPTLKPSIEIKIVVGYGPAPERAAIWRSVIHGHLEDGGWR